MAEVAKLAQHIWTQHYTPIIGEDQVRYMLHKFQSEKAIQDQINEGYNYFLIQTDNPIGYCSILAEKQSLFLSKIYVLHNQRGQGFGGMLIDFVKSQAKELNCDQIRLTVNKHNTNSIAAYHKMGFYTNREVVFDIGHGYIMDDFELILKL